MTRMTPEQAQHVLHDNITPPEPGSMTYYAQSFRALETLAADRLEYRVEHQHIDNGSWHPVTKWSPEWPLHEGHTVAPDERIVCRRVSEPWEVTDE